MRAKKEIDILMSFINGKIKSKPELDDELAKLRSGLGAFGVKLKKIKVTTTVAKKSDSPTANKSVSIKEL